MMTSEQELFRQLTTLCAQENSSFIFNDTVIGPQLFRTFSYRLASYTEFMKPGAIEARGITFLKMYEDCWIIASRPMQKFFNLGENPITLDIDWNAEKIVSIQNKLDGSLISTVYSPGSQFGFTLKSKTSFSSTQAIASLKLLELDENFELQMFCMSQVNQGRTVNMEYCAPDNQIVIGYAKPSLRVLNVRRNTTGEYIPTSDWDNLSEKFIVETIEVPLDQKAFIDSIYGLFGIEGYVVVLKSGLWLKIKTDWYCAIHKTKDSINSPKALFECCLNEASDDLRAMFAKDPVSLIKISEMEKLVSATFNRITQAIENYHKANIELSRKDYAIKGQRELDSGCFGLAMALYSGKTANVKEHMLKNYKSYGVSDDNAIGE